MSQSYRDLVWALLAQPLLRDSPAWQCPPRFDKKSLWPWLKALKSSPIPLEDALAQTSSRRLGLYYEQLWKFFFEHHPSYELLYHDQQIMDKKKTLGAFDFIYRDARGIVHRESAVKFYLGRPNQKKVQHTQWNQWLGPEKRDRFDLKMKKLLGHQLRLSEYPCSQRFLQAHHVTIDYHELDLKGILFYPLGVDMPSPKDAHPNHARGLWLPLKSLPQLQSIQAFKVLSRLEWLSPVKLSSKGIDFATMQKTLHDYFDQHQSPVQIAGLSARGPYLCESHRFFITPNLW